LIKQSKYGEKNKPAGATEILFGILIAAPQPFVLFSPLQELTIHCKEKT